MEIVGVLKDIVVEVENSKNVNLFNQKLQELLKNLIQSDLVSLFVYDQKTQSLNRKLFYNRKHDTLDMLENSSNSLSMIDPKGCIGKVFLTKTPAIHNHITSDKDYNQTYDNGVNYKLKSQLIYPIVENGGLQGVFRLSTTTNGVLKKYTSRELALVEVAVPCLLRIIKNVTSVGNVSDTKAMEDMNNILNRKKEVPIDNNDMLLFVSNTVHDIRTPANSLYGFLELLEEKVEDARLKQFVTNAKESASFINTLTNTILETTKNKYEAKEIKTTTVSTIHFLSEIADTFAAQMLDKKINYFIYINPNIPKEISIDSLKLKRVLLNLIGNAYKFTPPKHQINVNIDWNASDKRIYVAIKDTGIGIEEEDQKKLFKAFSQVGNDTQKKYGGSGLGLSISASYVADFGGELKLKSRIDEGSEFYFDIPIDVIDKSISYEPFSNLEKNIVILTEHVEAKYPRFIRNYLIKFGMPEDKIMITDTLQKDTTHLICFEEKITANILESAEAEKFKLLLLEQKLFSLFNKPELQNFNIISKNTYCADLLYSTVYSENKLNVLIVDDNKINVSLLESMLEGEYVKVSAYLNGEEALEHLKESANKGNRFDILYLDEHMPGISGIEMLEGYRAYEKEYDLKPIFAVSISGDPDMDKKDKKLYNAFVTKPFNKQEVREVISKLKN